MAKLNLAIVSAVLGLVLLPAQTWAVTNAVVGTCKAGTQFTTIQSAINSATAGSKIQICPGTYPELLTIQQNLTLTGVTSNKSDAVVIIPPSTGVPANGTSGLFGPLAIQVKIEVADVTLSNISIDGGGPNTTCPSSATWVGVLFQGTVGGSMTNSSVVDAPSCPMFGLAALVDATTNFTFTNNMLRDCSNVCLEVDFGSQTAVTNNLFNQANPNLQPQAIELEELGGPATVTGNVIGGITNGIYSGQSPSVTISNNTVMVTLAGIELYQSTQNIVTNNRISSIYYGLILEDNGVGKGNKLTNNTVFDAACGVDVKITPSGDTTAPNTYMSAAKTVCTVI
jgi:parallel beta-helix repeat protein